MRNQTNNDLNMVSIELNSIEDLFLEPEFNPLNLPSRLQSGIDDLQDQVQEMSRKRPLKICMSLATQFDEVDLEEKVKSAINRFCGVKIREFEQAIHELQSQGKKTLSMHSYSLSS